MKPELGARAPTGVPGLDEILGGGLPRRGLYLLKGDPGTGKTTLGLQFLREGARRGEPAVYITLTESEEQLRLAAASHGWSLEGIAIRELGGLSGDSVEAERYTLFHPTEVELGELTRTIAAAVADTVAPRVVVDSLSELRLLSGDALRYRRQILALEKAFADRQATVLLLDDAGLLGPSHLQIESLVRGVLHIEQRWPELADVRRRLRVLKLRASTFRGGYHDATIEEVGVVIHPRMRVADHRAEFPPEVASTGTPALDVLLGGGLDRGATALVMGPTGSGKSVLTTQIAVAAAERGEHVALFVFDEILDALYARAEGLGLGLREHVAAGRITVRQIDPGELAPWHFARAALHAAEEEGARVIAIDSLDGYLNAMPDERSLDLALHELFGCLSQIGVITVGAVVRHGFLGEHLASAVDVSYLSDTVILLSLFEAGGELRRAISVLKRRRGAHAHGIHELHIGPRGVRIGEALGAFHGVLTGLPTRVREEGWAPEDDGDEGG
jgi:circadian clock protein KaiC